MDERPRPDLERTREAMREHDENAEDESADSGDGEEEEEARPDDSGEE